MKKISLFYLLFALSSSHSLSAANSSYDKFLKPKGFKRCLLKYNKLVDTKKLSFIQTKDGFGNIETFIIQEITSKIANIKGIDYNNWPISSVRNMENIVYLNNDLVRSHEAKSIEKVLKNKEFIDMKTLFGSWDIVNLKNFPFEDSNLNRLIEEALSKGRGYVFFKDENNKIRVESFYFWEYNYKGICTLLAIPLVLVLGTLYSLGFFSSSETEKKNEKNYIA